MNGTTRMTARTEAMMMISSTCLGRPGAEEQNRGREGGKRLCISDGMYCSVLNNILQTQHVHTQSLVCSWRRPKRPAISCYWLIYSATYMLNKIYSPHMYTSNTHACTHTHTHTHTHNTHTHTHTHTPLLAGSSSGKSGYTDTLAHSPYVPTPVSAAPHCDTACTCAHTDRHPQVKNHFDCRCGSLFLLYIYEYTQSYCVSWQLIQIRWRILYVRVCICAAKKRAHTQHHQILILNYMANNITCS